MSQQHVGTVTAVNGPVLDIKFADGTLPNLMNAIEVEMADKKIVAEAAQHLGDDVVRCIAMSSTDGMVRGTKAVDTGAGSPQLGGAGGYHRDSGNRYQGR